MDKNLILEKKNRLRTIKTFEQFIGDNNEANVIIVKYLTDILALVTEKTKNLKFNEKLPSSDIGNGWVLDSIPQPSIYENEQTTETETSFINEQEEVEIIINCTYKPMFYIIKSHDRFQPDDEGGEIEFSIESVILWSNDYDNEYNIDLKNSVIADLVEKIINTIENK